MTVGELREKLRDVPDHHLVVVQDLALGIEEAEIEDVFAAGGCVTVIQANCERAVEVSGGC